MIPKPNWIDGAVEKLDEYANTNCTMLEWGSGRSTPYLANRVKYLYSIEHNHYWFTQVQSFITGKDNVSLMYRPYPPDVTYINAPFELNRRFEIIEIDGRLRNLCFDVALHYLIVENGLIIFDDIQEAIYRPSLEKIQHMRHELFTGQPGGKTTAIIHNVNPKTY